MTPKRWLDEYDKILVERTIMVEHALPGTVLRLPMDYGPRAYRLFGYLKRMDDGRSVILLNEEQARWCAVRSYVENVTAAIVVLKSSPVRE